MKEMEIAFLTNNGKVDPEKVSMLVTKEDILKLEADKQLFREMASARST